jgi:hypothetical protein
MTTISTKSHLRIPHLLKGSTVYLQRESRTGFFAITSFPRYCLSRGLGLSAGISELDSICPVSLFLPSDLPARGRLRYSQRTNTHHITGQPTILLPSAPSPRPRTQLARIPSPAHHPFLHHCASLDGAHDGSGITLLPARVLACPSS